MKATCALLAVMLLALCAVSASATLDEFTANIYNYDHVTGTTTGWSYGCTYWFQYDSGWWSAWFWDDPFDWNSQKSVHVHIEVIPNEPDWNLTFGVNWSTPEWSALGFGDALPPVPDHPSCPDPFDEGLYIERWPSDDGIVITEAGEYDYYFNIDDYNPEWVSVDVKCLEVKVIGTIEHECWTPVEQTTWGSVKAMFR